MITELELLRNDSRNKVEFSLEENGASQIEGLVQEAELAGIEGGKQAFSSGSCFVAFQNYKKIKAEVLATDGNRGPI